MTSDENNIKKAQSHNILLNSLSVIT